MPAHLMEEVVRIGEATTPEVMMLFRDVQNAFYGAAMTSAEPWTFAEQHAMQIRTAYDELDVSVKTDTILVVTVTDGEDGPLYFNE